MRQRQTHFDFQTAAPRVEGLDAPAVRGQGALGDGESQTRPAALAVAGLGDAVERRKQLVERGGGGNIRASGWLTADPVKLRQALGGRWLSANFRAGDLLMFSIFTVHASIDNRSDRVRLSSDSRYQRASESADPRWIGENPIGHGHAAKRGMIC